MKQLVVNSGIKRIQGCVAFVGTFSALHLSVCVFIVLRDLARDWGQPIDGHGLFSFIFFTLLGPIIAVEVGLGYGPLAALLSSIRPCSSRATLFTAGCSAIFCYLAIAVVESPLGFSLRRQFPVLRWGYDLGTPLAPMLLGAVSVVIVMLPLTIIVGAFQRRQVTA